MVAHDVAVGAGCGIVGEVRVAAGVHERVGADASHEPDEDCRYGDESRRSHEDTPGWVANAIGRRYPSIPLIIKFMSRVPAAALLAALSAVAIVAGQGRPRSTLEPLASPAGPNSAQPQLSSSARGVLLSWIERDGAKATLRYAERTAAGWSAPRDAASGTNWFVNWADVPSVMRLANGDLAAHWLQKSGAETYAYDVRLAYSKDDGKTWSPSFLPHSDRTRTEHGFASLFQMPGGGLGLTWLDGRATKPGESHGGHGGGGAMTVHAAAFGRDWKQTFESPVDTRVCDCCPTTVAVTSEGPIMAYRNRTDDEVRDIFISRFEKGTWSEPAAVHHDGWKIAACPVNGPMLSASGRDVAIVWFTAKDDRPRAWVAFSTDAGRTFGTPIRLDDSGTLGRVDVELMPDGSAVASWIEFAEQRAQLRVRRVQRSGVRSTPVTVSDVAGSRASGYPRLAAAGKDVVLAWTETGDGRSHVRAATIRGAVEVLR